MPWTRDKKKNIRLAFYALAVFVAGIGLYFARDPISALTRGIRAKHNLRRAVASSEEAAWEEAFQQALVARQLDPQSIEPLRLVTRAAFNSRSPRTLDYARALFLHPNAEKGDKLLALTILQNANDYVGFVRYYNLLPLELRQERDFVIVRVRFLIARNAFDTARELLENEVSQHQDRRFLLLLASLLVQPSATPEEMARGQRIIAELVDSEGGDDTARSAFELLGFIDLERLRPDLLGDLGARAAGGSSVTTAQYLAAASLAIAAARSPEDRRLIVEQAVADQAPIAPVQLAAWLERVGEGEEALAFLTPERCADDPELFDMRFGALLRTGRLEEAGGWLANPPVGFEAIQIWLSRAQLTRLSSERAAESNAWEQAFQVAQNTATRNEYLRIFEVAEKVERPDIAARALLKAPSHPVGILPPAADTIRPMLYLAENDRLGDLRFLTEALYAREPENPGLLNNLLYLNLLLGSRIETSTRSAADLAKLRPEMLSARTTHAMGLLMQGEVEAALAALPEESEAWERATPADLAIRAAVMERAGRPEAEAIWGQVDLKQLNEAERRLLLQTDAAGAGARNAEAAPSDGVGKEVQKKRGEAPGAASADGGGDDGR